MPLPALNQNLDLCWQPQSQCHWASSWCSRGWPSFPEPPLDHFRALDTKATRSGELGSIRLNSLARFSETAQQTLTRRAGSLQLSARRQADERPAVCPVASHGASATQGCPVDLAQSQQPCVLPPHAGPHAGLPAPGSLGWPSMGSQARVLHERPALKLSHR